MGNTRISLGEYHKERRHSLGVSQNPGFLFLNHMINIEATNIQHVLITWDVDGFGFASDLDPGTHACFNNMKIPFDLPYM